MRPACPALLIFMSGFGLWSCEPKASSGGAEAGSRDLARSAIHAAFEGGAFDALMNQAVASSFAVAKNRVEGSGRRLTAEQSQELEAALRKVHTKTLEDGSPVHSFQTLHKLLSTIVRNRCRVPAGGSNAPTFDVVTTPTAEQQRAGQLSAALTEKDRVLQQTMARLAHEDLMTQELQDRLLAMQRQFDQAQGELAVALQSRTAETSGAGGGMVQLEKVVVSQPALADSASQGHVVSVHPEWKFVVIDLGWDAVRIGDVVSIYRDEELLGKARVERVQEKVSAVTLLPDWMQTEVRVNDIVRVL